MIYNKEELEQAKNEGKIEPVQLMYEILPLLKEYMIGNFSVENENLILSFLNGQKFRMSIKAV